MNKDQQIKEQLRKLAGLKGSPFISAIVTAVDGDTCTVKLASGLEIEGVRLRAGVSGSDHFILEPKLQTNVLIADLSGDFKNMAVIQVEECAALRYKQNGLEFLIDSNDGKCELKNNGTSLHDLFQKMVDILLAFTVSTPAGPSGTALPTSVAQINAFKTEFKTLLK